MLPGVWVFGSTDDEDRNMGMGVVIEYENRQGEPQWIKPTKDDWAYATFAMTSGKAGATGFYSTTTAATPTPFICTGGEQRIGIGPRFAVDGPAIVAATPARHLLEG
jgi:hypothetical protein